MTITVMFAGTAADSSQSDSAVLNYAMCVNKVLHMQQVFLTECESDGKNSAVTTSTSVLATATEGSDASKSASSSLTVDTASTNTTVRPAAESDEVTLHLEVHSTTPLASQ